MSPPIAILHLDESCLGNGLEGENPGGAGGLIEVRGRRGKVERRDFFLHEQATTNNRMALKGATLALELLGRKGTQLAALMVSDSQYLVRGMREWVTAWKANGWRRKSGAIENLELWKKLDAASRRHQVQWTWLRGHYKHPKNEFADWLAVRAAREQRSSDGAVASEFTEWLAAKQKAATYSGYDPDAAFEKLERRMAAGEEIPLLLNER